MRDDEKDKKSAIEERANRTTRSLHAALPQFVLILITRVQIVFIIFELFSYPRSEHAQRPPSSHVALSPDLSSDQKQRFYRSRFTLSTFQPFGKADS